LPYSLNTAYRKIIKYEWEHPDYDASQDKFMQRFDEKEILQIQL
jgi:hypothetical protein